jgi:class 3 adenylate cyclase/tetratricopeptide (TPR) repeat protein
MECPWCQRRSVVDSSFCEECGARLESACPTCGEVCRVGAKFCRKCGQVLRQPGANGQAVAPRFGSPQSYIPKHLAERILNSEGSLKDERKQVTVLFADMRGSLEIVADRDPEDVRAILDPVLELMMDAVHRYEGVVNQVMGDGVMAIFGAPLAREDHAVRACYAALRMQESVYHYGEAIQRQQGVSIQIRVGLNSGEVVVRSINSDLHMEYSAIGQTTHLAARMEQMARPGTTLLTASTHRLTEGYVEVKPLGLAAVRGLDVLMDVFELQGVGPARSRLQAAAGQGLTRFVGRSAEFDHLERTLDKARGGRGQVMAIVGEPGVGKSRLLWEFTHSSRAKGCLILETGSVSYGAATAYLPITELLKTYFQADGRDDTRKIREKVSGKLAALDETLLAALPVFLTLIDVPVEDSGWQMIDPSQRRQRTMEACERLFLRESQANPVCLVFEDLHWIDSETQAFLEGLVERLPSARILLLVSHRLEYKTVWGSKSYYSQLRVDPLPPSKAEEMLTILLGEDRDLQPLKRILIERTDGNPFFLEENVRNLAETEVLVRKGSAYQLTKPLPTVFVPATVQAVLAARVDRLPPDEKTILQLAAVIGHTLPFALLKEISEAPEEELQRVLAHLTAAEMLYQTSLFPELEYGFRHALTHEVVYQSLLHDQQRRLHVQILGAIERLYPDRLIEHIERLAHHAFRGELWEEAVTYLCQAGRKARARSALQDARAWFENALRALEMLPASQTTLEQAFETRLELRPVLNLLGEVRIALERLREAEALAERLNDDRRRGRVCAFVTNVYSLTGELDQALVSGNRALAIAQTLVDLELRVTTTTYLEHAHYLRGEYEQVVTLASANLAALPADRVYEYFGNAAPASVYDRCWLVLSLAHLGRFAEANEPAAEAMRLAGVIHHAFSRGLAYRAASTLELLRGDWAQARSLIEEWLSVVRAGDVVLQLTRAVASSAWVLAHFGRTDEAIDRLREGEELLERHATRGLLHNLGWDYYSLARAYLLLGRLDEAKDAGDRSLKSSPRHPGFAAHALHLLADVATHPDRFDPERGEGYYQKALALAEVRGMRPLVALCHLGLGRLNRRRDERLAARDHLDTAITMCQAMDMPFWLEQSEQQLKALS